VCNSISRVGAQLTAQTRPDQTAATLFGPNDLAAGPPELIATSTEWALLSLAKTGVPELPSNGRWHILYSLYRL
jgi:hypothetical protein